MDLELTYIEPVTDDAMNRKKNLRELIFSAAAILVVQIALMTKPIIGVYLNTLVFGLFMAMALRFERARGFAIGCSIILVANMATICFNPTKALAIPALYESIILILALVYRYMLTIDYPTEKTKLSLSGYAMFLPPMVMLGQVIGVVSYLGLRYHYAFHGVSIWLVAGSVVVFAIAEEVLLRGLIQQQATRIFHPQAAAALSAVFGIVLYANYHIPATIAVGVLLQIACAAVYYKKQNLLLTITLNATTKLVYVALVAVFILH